MRAVGTLHLARVAALLALAGVAAGCGLNTDTSSGPSAVAGSQTATQAMAPPPATQTTPAEPPWHVAHGRLLIVDSVHSGGAEGPYKSFAVTLEQVEVRQPEGWVSAASAEDLASLKGVSRGEHIEVFRSYWPDGYTWDALAANHLNCYLTARLYWDATQDVDALLEEYYDLFYGPARAEMKAFIEYTEANWMKATQDVAVIDQLFELLGAAEAAAGEGIYGRRVALITDYMQRLHQLRERLATGREDAPEARAVGGRHPATLTLDGALDDPFWEGLYAYPLRELQTGERPGQRTTVKFAWAQNALVLGIDCRDDDMANLRVGSTRDGDANIWSGDTIEVLLETQVHSYYQIAISPSGAVVSADRARGIDPLWSAQAEVAAKAGEEGWSLEVRIPVTDGADPLKGVAGRQPSRTFPWYFNVCRQRVREPGNELSAFSPTGGTGFHDTLKFGKLFVP